MELYSSCLSAYEVDEIQNYSKIWFLGVEADKVKAVTGAALNNGFDDQHGSYTKVFRLLSSIYSGLYLPIHNATTTSCLVSFVH